MATRQARNNQHAMSRTKLLPKSKAVPPPPLPLTRMAVEEARAEVDVLDRQLEIATKELNDVVQEGIALKAAQIELRRQVSVNAVSYEQGENTISRITEKRRIAVGVYLDRARVDVDA